MENSPNLFAFLFSSDGVFIALASGLGIGLGGTFVTLMFSNKSRQLEKIIKKLRAEIQDLQKRYEKYIRAFNALQSEEVQLWSLHNQKRPDAIAAAFKNSSLQTICVANLKGGVGKTTVAANLAAFLDVHMGKRVLLIDLDFQGSLSNMASHAADIEDVGGLSDDLIFGDLTSDLLAAKALPLRPALRRTALVPAFYDLQQRENQLLVRWVVDPDRGDIRYNVASTVLGDEISNNFDVVIFDAPPRLSVAAIGALAASKFLIVPTTIDHLSIDAAKTFLRQIRLIKHDLNPELQLAGILPTLSQGLVLSPNEETRMAGLAQATGEWGAHAHVFQSHIPRLASIAAVAGRDFAYNTDKKAREVFDSFGVELCQRIGITASVPIAAE